MSDKTTSNVVPISMASRVENWTGKGRFFPSVVTACLFADKRLGFSDAQLERLAKTLNADLGRCFASAQSKGISFGAKPDKGGRFNLRDLGSVLKEALTPSLKLAGLGLAHEKLSFFGLDLAETAWVLTPEIQAFFDAAEPKANAQQS